MIEVIIDQRGQQIVCHADGVGIAGEVEVEILHRHDLRVATTGRAALNAECGAERGLADVGDGSLADAVERLGQADGGQRLAFAQRRGCDAGDHHELAVGPVAQPAEHIQRDLRLVLAVLLDFVIEQPQAAGDLGDRPELCCLCDLQVALHGHGVNPLSPTSSSGQS